MIEARDVKGVITNIQRFSADDGPGIRTTVFFKGCNLDCAWCHNPETKSPRPQTQIIGGVSSVCGRGISAGELCAAVTRDKPFFDRSGGGVTFSGGEPLLQPDFLRECLRLCKEGGLRTVVDTAGNVPFSSFVSILPYTDMILYDVKLLDAGIHKRYTGISNERILENLHLLYANRGGTEIVVRTLLLPGINDNDRAFAEFARFLEGYPGLKVELLPYHSMGEGKYKIIGEECRYSGVKPPEGAQAEHYKRILYGYRNQQATMEEGAESCSPK